MLGFSLKNGLTILDFILHISVSLPTLAAVFRLAIKTVLRNRDPFFWFNNLTGRIINERKTNKVHVYFLYKTIPHQCRIHLVYLSCPLHLNLNLLLY